MKIRKHKHLDSQIWNKDQTLKAEVANELLTAAWEAIDHIRCEHGLDIYNYNVKDIIIQGSIANYVYTKKSDINLYIILDIAQIQKQNPKINIEQMIQVYCHNWLMYNPHKIHKHHIDVIIKGILPKVRINIGGYSMMRREWLLKPLMLTDLQFANIEMASRNIYRKIMRDYNNVAKDGFQPQAVKVLYSNIIDSKNLSLSANTVQTVTPMYIAWERVYNEGIIDKLRKELNK